ncbi:hypothetical protein QUW56_02660 [Phocaeicola barnesiae]|uniref:hypothetical protein n=1 Tax=Phocaeicola barnesiae TaxID=376804 RepID=UPI0025A3ED78|nr:hypothetical protein [Phocaeicola barnesiae]MDM8232300.1 hypothetical protein [Phocaeicola barnesiae]
MKIEEIASMGDLLLELFLRKRESGSLVWKTKEGKTIPIKDLSDNHLISIIRMIDRKNEEGWNYLEALGSIGDADI